jgi:hypothetical protein
VLQRVVMRSFGKPQPSKFAVERARLREPSLDAEPSRNPVFDAIGRGLMTLGQKVAPPGVDAGRI